MTKEQAIKKIKETPSIYLNDDQKRIAKGIINSIPKGQDVLNYFDFIIKRADVGFKFDVAPEIAIGRIAIVNEMQDLNLNVSKQVNINENKLIIGDNYEALKNLLLTHKEKIDVIYIDPPYNTDKSKEDGNASSKEGVSSKFIYKDKFGRNGWLNMMRDRLVLAKRLLSSEGIIFVSIDDSEQAYLKVLMDEIFGEKNFVSSFPRCIASGGKNNGNTIAKEHDYIICYSFLSDFSGLLVDEKKFKLDDNDGRGKYQLRSLVAAPGAFKRNGSQTLPFDFNGKKIFPKKSNGDNWYWRWGKERMKLGKKINLIIEKNNSLYAKLYFNYDFKQGHNDLIKKQRTKLASSRTWDDIAFSNGKGSNDIKDLNLQFSFPKPVSLLKSLILLIKNKNIIVLDFFAGSGTTAQAIMELNNEDGGGGRTFILVTNNENNIALDVTYERLYRIIIGKTTDGKKDFKWLDKNEPFVNIPLRVFNIKHFDVETNQSEKLEEITNFAISNLEKLNPLYKPNNIQVYYDLDGLNPLNEAQKRQEYSIDPIIHEKFEQSMSNKFYCTCGKSFVKEKELNKHFNKNSIRDIKCN